MEGTQAPGGWEIWVAFTYLKYPVSGDRGGGGGEQEIVTGTIITTIFCRIGALTIFAFVSVVPGSVVMKMKLLYFITCSFLDFVIVG